MRHPPRLTDGFTLLELVLVLAILGIVALAAVPSFTSRGDESLDLAAAEVAAALRFARSEAVRTQEVHGVDVTLATHTLRAFHLQNPGSPVSAQPTLYHPSSKQPYQYDLPNLPFSSGAVFQSMSSAFSDNCNRVNAVAFDVRGMPVCGRPTTSRVTQWDIVVAAGGQQRTVSVAPGTGRVTIQ